MDIRELVKKEKEVKEYIDLIEKFKRLSMCNNYTIYLGIFNENTREDENIGINKDSDLFNGLIGMLSVHIDKNKNILEDIQTKLKKAGDVVDS